MPFTSDNILSEGNITGTTIVATTISAGTFYGSGVNLTGITSAAVFTGGTVTGPTNFTAGLTANTFSANSVNINGVVSLRGHCLLRDFLKRSLSTVSLIGLLPYVTVRNQHIKKGDF